MKTLIKILLLILAFVFGWYAPELLHGQKTVIPWMTEEQYKAREAKERSEYLQLPTFYVSGPTLKATYRVHAKDRLWAEVTLGSTVWTKREWEDAKKRICESGSMFDIVQENGTKKSACSMWEENIVDYPYGQ